MQTMTAAWLPAWQADNIITVSWAEVWSGINGSWLATLLIEGASVTDDWTNAVRRTLSGVVLTDPTGTLTPKQATDLLYPVGHELVVYSGLAYVGGAMRAALAAQKSVSTILSQPYTPALGVANGFEAARLGTFLMEGVKISDRDTDLTITLSGKDRATDVQRARFTNAYATNGTDTLDVAIQKLVTSVVTNLTFSFAPLSYVPPVQAWNVGDDAWAAAQKLASDAGYKLDFDVTGSLRLYAVVDPSTVPTAATYAEGAGCTITSLDRDLSNVNVPNWIIGIAQGSGVTTPIRADWQDTDVQSPTYIGGSYPTTIEKITTSTATTLAQVQAMVNAQGALNKGKLEQAQMALVGNPAHEAGDVVSINRARAGVRGSLYVLDRITHSLPSGTSGQGRLVA